MKIIHHAFSLLIASHSLVALPCYATGDSVTNNPDNAAEKPRPKSGCGFGLYVRDGLTFEQYFRLTQIYLSQHKLTLARQCMAKMRECDPKEGEKRAKIFEDTMLPLMPAPPEAVPAIEDAIARLSNPKDARQKLEKIIVDFAQLELPYLLLGDIECQTGNIDKAEELYKKVLTINPHAALALRGLSQVAGKKCDNTKANEIAKQAHALNPYLLSEPGSVRIPRALLRQLRKVHDSPPVLTQNPASSPKTKAPPIVLPNLKHQLSTRPLTTETLGLFARREFVFIDKKGNQAFRIGPHVSVGSVFCDGIAVARVEDEGVKILSGVATQYWDYYGDLAFDETFEDGKDFSDGLCAVRNERFWGFCNTRGKTSVPIIYYSVRPFSEELAAVKATNFWGLISKLNEWMVEPIYDDCLSPSGGLSAVEIKGKVGFVDGNGLMAIKPIYDQARSFSDGVAEVATINEKDGSLHIKYLDQKGKECFDLNDVMSKYGHPIFIAADEKHNRSDRTLYPNALDLGAYSETDDFEHFDFHNDRLPILLGNKLGYLNKHGEIAIPPLFDDGGEFAEGLACVNTGIKSGYIDRFGKLKIQPQFIGACSFSNGLAAVTKDGKYWGYINQAGKMIIPAQFGIAESFHEGLAKVTKSR